MSYHSDYWVVVGTAAPVIALAHVVTVGRALRAIFGKNSRGHAARDVVVVMAIVAILGVITCAAPLVQALLSLEWERDAGHPVFASVSVFVAFALLIITLVYEQIARNIDPSVSPLFDE